MAFEFNRPYVRNNYRYFTPLFLPGEDYSFYMNMDVIPSDDFWEHYSVFLLNSVGVQVAQLSNDIGTGGMSFDKVNVAGNIGYNLYCSNFIFPMVVDGEYYLQIYNDATEYEMWRSQTLLCSSHCVENTTKVRFRHNDSLYGIRYDLLPNFYNKFRLPINQIGSIEVRSDRTQYRESANGRDLRNSKSFRDLVLTLEFYWADDDDLIALSAMLEHDEIYISGNRVMNISQLKIQRASEASKLSKATFEVIVNDYNLDDSLLENYGNFIAWGGNTFNIGSIFAQP